MKISYPLMLLSFLSCSAQKKLRIETVLTKPMTVTSQDAVTGRRYHKTTYIPTTPRLEPKILLKANAKNRLSLLLQGNISSGGHSINRVKKIRFEKGEQNGNTLTLKYYVEIKRIPGKEDANVRGYNYSKIENYSIPDDIKLVNVELYEEQINQSPSTKPRIIAAETFDFSLKI